MSTETKKKGLGTFDFFFVGFGAIVGVGWAVSLNKWMASAGGPVPASIGYLVTLILMVPVGLCFAELVPMLPVAGGTTTRSELITDSFLICNYLLRQACRASSKISRPFSSCSSVMTRGARKRTT